MHRSPYTNNEPSSKKEEGRNRPSTSSDYTPESLPAQGGLRQNGNVDGGKAFPTLGEKAPWLSSHISGVLDGPCVDWAELHGKLNMIQAMVNNCRQLLERNRRRAIQ